MRAIVLFLILCVFPAGVFAQVITGTEKVLSTGKGQGYFSHICDDI